MKFGLLSDTHIDFIFKAGSAIKPNAIKVNFDRIFKNNDIDVLLIPGDIGHYNNQNITFLKMIGKMYGIKHIVVTYGNHELYLFNKTLRSNYKFDSGEKIAHYKKLFVGEKNIHFLDGDVVEIGGIKIGGACGWYDDSYFRKVFSSGSYGESVEGLWQMSSNDANHIFPKGKMVDLTLRERPKVHTALETGVDIMMTHICPVSEPLFVRPEYRHDKTTTFYTFDGEELVMKYAPKYWVHGHLHDVFSMEIHGTQIMRNPYGYPGESGTARELVTFEI